MIPTNSDVPQWMRNNIPDSLLTSELFVYSVILRVKDPETNKRKVITLNMLPDLDTDYEHLEKQMEDLPAQYAFWAAVYSELRNNVALLERTIKKRRGNAVIEIQRSALAEGVKLTADQVKTVLESDEELHKNEIALANLQMQVGKVYHMMEALQMKANLVRSLGSIKRQEYENQ